MPKLQIEDEEVDWDLTPMIDIVFLLIAFFMIVARMIDSTLVKIEVPFADKSKVPESTEYRITVTVDGEGTMYFGPQAVDTPEEITNLLVEAKNARGGGDRIEVYVRGDKDTEHKDIQEMLKAIGEADIPKIKFAAFRKK